MSSLNGNGDFEKRPHQRRVYALIDKDGNAVAHSVCGLTLAIVAGQMFPDQQQDPERLGNGWDVEAVR